MQIANLVFYSIYAVLALTLLMLTHRNVRDDGQHVSKLSSSWLSYGVSNIAFACVPALGIPAIVLGNLLISASGIFMLLIYREWRTGSKFPYEAQLWCLLAGVIAYLTYLQYNGTFAERVLFMTCFGFVMYAWSAAELVLNKNTTGQFQRRLLLGIIGLSLLMLGARLYAIANQVGGASTSFQTESLVTFGMSWSWNTLILLNQILIGSYYIDKMWRQELNLTQALSAEKQLVSTLEHNIQAQEQANAKLAQLLAAKNNMLKRLSMAEKTGMLGALAGSLAHELNQPLCANKLNIDSLKQVASDQPEAPLLTELLTQLEKDNARIERIIKRVDKLFRRGSTAFGDIPLSQLVGECCELMEKDFHKHQITLSTQLDENAKIHGDYGQIETVVLNLLTNAIDAMRRTTGDKQLHIEVRTLEKTVTLTVADTGHGIPESALTQVFDPFYSTKDNGMGVGLWLTKSIVEHHQANIKVTNNPQTGSTFDVYFPKPSKHHLN